MGGGLHGAGADAHGLRGLFDGQVEVVAQDDRLALPPRQFPQRGGDRALLLAEQRAGLGGLGQPGGRAPSAACGLIEAVVGDRAGQSRSRDRRRSAVRQPFTTLTRRYASGAAMSGSRSQRRYRPRNASCTMSSAAARSPVMTTASRTRPSACSAYRAVTVAAAPGGFRLSAMSTYQKLRPRRKVASARWNRGRRRRCAPSASSSPRRSRVDPVSTARRRPDEGGPRGVHAV